MEIQSGLGFAIFNIYFPLMTTKTCRNVIKLPKTFIISINPMESYKPYQLYNTVYTDVQTCTHRIC